MKSILTAFTLLTIVNVLFMKNSLAACSCKVKSHEQLFNQASHISYGKVASKSYKDGFHVYLFKNVKLYKGELEKNNIIIKVAINECSITFEPGQHYIVYINKLIKNIVYMNQCHHYYPLNEETINKPVHIQLLDTLGMKALVKKTEKQNLLENKNSKKLLEKLESFHEKEDKKY